MVCRGRGHVMADEKVFHKGLPKVLVI